MQAFPVEKKLDWRAYDIVDISKFFLVDVSNVVGGVHESQFGGNKLECDGKRAGGNLITLITIDC